MTGFDLPYFLSFLGGFCCQKMGHLSQSQTTTKTTLPEVDTTVHQSEVLLLFFTSTGPPGLNQAFVTPERPPGLFGGANNCHRVGFQRWNSAQQLRRRRSSSRFIVNELVCLEVPRICSVASATRTGGRVNPFGKPKRSVATFMTVSFSSEAKKTIKNPPS